MMLPIAILISLILFPSLAFAQTHAHGVDGGFMAGISHPVLGLDHLLAMVAVGIVSAQVAARKFKHAIWSVPACFVIVMVLGGALGMIGIGLTAIELGIVLSVIILGLVIAGGGRINALILFASVALFAVFHGFAHGQEIPELASSGAYIAGFMIGTAGLHLIGVVIGHLSDKVPDGATLLRYSGAIVSGMGFHILLQMAGY
ncbi:MAG: HupE/UreJ family protein [Lentilitoribacter sp.]